METAPATKKAEPRNRCASGSRRSQRDAPRPPRAIPDSTTPSISANEDERVATKYERTRNHTTSNASRENPAAKAAASHGRRRGVAASESSAAGDGSTGVAPSVAPGRRARASAATPTATLSAPATK